MSGGEYGATIRSGDTCYDYSWNHLEEISCKSKNFIFSGPQSTTSVNKNKDDPIKNPDVTVTGYKTPGTGPKPPVAPVPWTKKQQKANQPLLPTTGDDYPDWFEYVTVVADSNMNRPPWTFEFDDKAELKIIRYDIKQEVPGAQFVTVNDFGKISGNTYHATKTGSGSIRVGISVQYRPKGGGDIKTYVHDPVNLEVYVNPPMKPFSHWPDDKDMTAVSITIYDTDGVHVGVQKRGGKGFVVSLQGENTPNVTKEVRGKSYTSDVEFTVGELNHLPPAIYTIYAYLRTDSVGSDMHAIKKYKVALPVQQGSCWKRRVIVEFAAKNKNWVVPPPQHMGKSE
ncbi:MAG: hypothetical protein P9M03_09895 [Candidatus Theseobacter exili]|nr:hypothetical protein [Candidatus Theseobacter exili]